LFGELKISGVSGPDAPGAAYTITAEYDGNVISAKLDVTARGKIGTVDAAVKSLIEISPDGTRLYLYEEPGSNRVSIVDTTTFEIIGRHERDGVIGQIIASPDGENVYIGVGGNTQSVIRVENWQKVATFTTPDARHGVLSLDGAYGYFVGTNRVHVVDNSNFRIKEVVPVNYSWWWDGMAISDRYLYIVGYAANSVPSLVNVHVFDTLTNKVLRSGPGIKYSDRYKISVSPGDKLLYVFGRSNIMVFDSLSLAEVRSVDLVNPVLNGSVMSLDGRLIYFINEKFKISAMDAESLRVIKDFDVVGSPFTLKLSHDNSRLYYSCSDKLGVTVIQVE
jgi:DNA-binding beta-propeller fold protein YncE